MQKGTQSAKILMKGGKNWQLSCVGLFIHHLNVTHIIHEQCKCLNLGIKLKSTPLFPSALSFFPISSYAVRQLRQDLIYFTEGSEGGMKELL